MNDAQLQEAINKAREFMNIPATEHGLLWQARSNTKKQLEELEKIQIERACLASKPSIIEFKGKL
jgi:hypothetical protein